MQMDATTRTDLTGTDRMVQYQLQMMNEVTMISQRLYALENGQQTLMKSQEYIVRTLNQVLTKLTVDTRKTPKKPPAQKSLQTKRKALWPSDVSTLLHLPQALQKNINRFTDNVLFNPTNIPDELIASECLSEDECSHIASKTTYKEQARLMVRKIKSRGPQVIEKFLEIVGKDHPDLPQEVHKTLESIVNESKQKPVCVICVMRLTVDLKDVVDDLWSADIISDDIYDDIVDCESIHQNRTILWDNIINSINNSEEPSHSLEILVNALESKYNHIVEYLRETPERPTLSCSCCKRRRVRPRATCSDIGSLTDLSTTSEVHKIQVPKTVFMAGEYSSEESGSFSSSQEVQSGSFRGISFDYLERYESIGSGSEVFSQNLEIQNPTISSTTNDSNNDVRDRNRHSSGHFVPRDQSFDKTEYDEDYLGIPLISKPTENEQENSLDRDKERPELIHSTSMHSNVTICVSRSTGSGEADHNIQQSSDENPNKRSSVSTDCASPDVNQVQIQNAQFPYDNGNESTKETEKESDAESPLFLRHKAYRRRRQRSASETVADDEEEQYQNSSSYIDRARQRRYQRKRFARQKSLPHGDITLITSPRPKSDQSVSNVGVRAQESRKSKQSIKRQTRRLRSQSKDFGTEIEINNTSPNGHEDKGLKKPFNPLWGKDFTQPKLSPNWDHNQAKRYWQMAQRYAMSSRAQQNKSDTDLRVGDLSDAMAFSDFTA